MEHVLFFGAVFLTCLMQGSPAVSPVFVQKGKDVLLEVMEADVPQDFVIFQWQFNGKDVLISFQPGSIPKPDSGRIELSGKSYSVTLKNLQEADSGVYTARVIGTKENRISREYNVTVQDAVSPVKLRADSVSNSSETCNITVTCSTADSDISATFRCDTKTCSPEGGERSKVTASGASLHLYLADESIICNHSNQVSSVKDEKKIFDFCPRLVGPPTTRPRVITIVISVVAVVAVIAISAAVVWNQKRGNFKFNWPLYHRNNRETIENTVYAVPEVKMMPTLDRTPGDIVSGDSPNTTYSMVGNRIGTMGSNQTSIKTLPDSVYAQIEKPARN